MNTKPRVPLLFFLSLLLITCFYYVYVFLPLQENIDHITSQTQIINQKLTMYKSLETKIDTLKKDVLDIDTKVSTFGQNRYSVNGHNFANDVQAGVRKSGVQLLSVNASQPQKIYSSNYIGIYEMSTALEFNCNNDQLSLFLDYFENSKTACYYITSALSNLSGGNYNVKLDLLLFYPEKLENVS